MSSLLCFLPRIDINKSEEKPDEGWSPCYIHENQDNSDDRTIPGNCYMEDKESPYKYKGGFEALLGLLLYTMFFS